MGFFLESEHVMLIGLFALSGAITNHLAIYMLFHKVRFLYGSGVVEARFEAFKNAISTLMMEQFFNQTNIQKFLKSNQEEIEHKDFTPLIEATDLGGAFENLKSAVMESSFGGMLGMFGGAKVLEPLKIPFESKMKKSLIEIVHTDEFQKNLIALFTKEDISDQFQQKIKIIVQERLDELTPKMVRDIIENMIKEHLGWLVVWGGVFGGAIGLVATLLSK